MAKESTKAMRDYLEANDVKIPAKAKTAVALKKIILGFWDENEIEPEFKCDTCGGTFPDDESMTCCPWCGSEFDDDDEPDDDEPDDDADDADDDELDDDEPDDDEPADDGDDELDDDDAELDDEEVISKPKKAKGKKMNETKKKATPKETPAEPKPKATPKKKAPEKKSAAKSEKKKATPKKKESAAKPEKKKSPAKKKSSSRASTGAWSTGVSVSAQLKDFNGTVIQKDGKISFTDFRLGIESIAAKLEAENPEVVESMKRLRRRAQYAVMPAAHDKPFGKKELAKLVSNWVDAHEKSDDRNTKFANSAMACLAGGRARLSSVLEEPNYDALWEAGAMIEKAIKSTKTAVVEKLAVKIMAVFGWELLE